MFSTVQPTLPLQGVSPPAAVTPEVIEQTEDIYILEALEEQSIPQDQL